MDDSLNKDIIFVFFLIFVLPRVFALSIDFDATTDSGSLSQNNIFVNISSNENEDHFTFLDFNNDLVLWMPFDSVNGSGNPIDLSTFGNNGTLIGTTAINSGNGTWGNGIWLNGSGSYVNLGDDNGFNFTEGFSYGAWFKADNFPPSAWNGILSRGDFAGSGIKGFYLAVSSIDNKTRCYNGGINEGVLSNSVALVSEWYHVMCVHNGTDTFMYVDGVLQDDFTTGDYDVSNTGLIHIGKTFTDLSNSYWNGSIDEVMIFNRTLTTDEILALYNASANQYSRNFTWLSEGNYNYTAYAVNTSGNYVSTTGFTTLTFYMDILAPVSWEIFQRNNSNYSDVYYEINSSQELSNLYYRVDNGSWNEISMNNNLTPFGNISVEIGFHNITFNGSNSLDTHLEYTIENVSVGDIFVIMGQSNAVNPGYDNTTYTPNPSNGILPSMYRAGYLVSSQNWSMLDDPTGHNSGGSAWSKLSELLTDELDIPIGFITTAVGATKIYSWVSGGSMFLASNSSVYNATRNTAKVKGVLFLQGESDQIVNTTNYGYYYGELENFVNTTYSEWDIQEDEILVGVTSVIPSSGRTREANDAVKLAQQDCWSNISNCGEGIQMYDLFYDDGAHTKTRGGLDAVAYRWFYSILDNYYDNSIGRSPILLNASYFNNDKRMVLKFDHPVNFYFWNGTQGSRAYGFRIDNGSSTLTDDDIGNVTFLNSLVYLSFSNALSDNLNVTYGSFNDSYNLAVIVDNTTMKMPARFIVNFSVDYYENASTDAPVFSNISNLTISSEDSVSIFINATTVSALDTISVNDTTNFEVNSSQHIRNVSILLAGTYVLNVSVNDSINNIASDLIYITITSDSSSNPSTPSSSGVGPTYYSFEDDLIFGVTRHLGENFKVLFSVDNEQHSLVVNNLDNFNQTATFTVSSVPKTKTLSIGDFWRLDLDNDNYYDLYVRLDKVTRLRTDVYMKIINEGVREADGVIEESTWTKSDSSGRGSVGVKEYGKYYLWFLIILLIVIVLVLFSKLSFRRKFKRKFFLNKTLLLTIMS